MNQVLGISVMFLFFCLGIYFLMGTFIMVSNEMFNPESTCYIDPSDVIRIID
jgi:hypothetical protein